MRFLRFALWINFGWAMLMLVALIHAFVGGSRRYEQSNLGVRRLRQVISPHSKRRGGSVLDLRLELLDQRWTRPVKRSRLAR